MGLSKYLTTMNRSKNSAQPRKKKSSAFGQLAATTPQEATWKTKATSRGPRMMHHGVDTGTSGTKTLPEEVAIPKLAETVEGYRVDGMVHNTYDEAMFSKFQFGRTTRGVVCFNMIL